MCLRLHLPVSSSVPCTALSDCVTHSHFVSGLLLLLSVVCASRGPVASYAHHVLFQVLAAPLMHSFYVLQPDMPLCHLACVLVCSQQGRLAHHVSMCYFHHAHAALFHISLALLLICIRLPVQTLLLPNLHPFFRCVLVFRFLMLTVSFAV